MSSHMAQVAVLTAEVRVLMVGSRQVTLSVYRQLDWVTWNQCEPFGRTNAERDGTFAVIGRDRTTGTLVRATLHSQFERRLGETWGADEERDYQNWIRYTTSEHLDEEKRQFWVEKVEATSHRRRRAAELQRDIKEAEHDFHCLPLIVLAGLK